MLRGILRVETLGQFCKAAVDFVQNGRMRLLYPALGSFELLADGFKTCLYNVIVGLVQILHDLANLIGKQVNLVCELVDDAFR